MHMKGALWGKKTETDWGKVGGTKRGETTKAGRPNGDFGSSSTRDVHSGPFLALTIQSLAKRMQPTPHACAKRSRCWRGRSLIEKDRRQLTCEEQICHVDKLNFKYRSKVGDKDLVSLLLGVHVSKELETSVSTGGCTWLFMEALFPIGKDGKQPRRPWVDEW